MLDTNILIYAEQGVFASSPTPADALASADERFLDISEIRAYVPSDLKLPV